MAPSATEITTAPAVHNGKSLLGESTKARQPVTNSGSLHTYEQNDITPSIGTEIPGVQIRTLLTSPNADTLIKDLAVTVSERGVVFLRNQDVTTTELKSLGEKLSTLTGSPSSSGLHTHPLTESSSELGDQISVISSVKRDAGAPKKVDLLTEPGKLASNGWHADITFEPVPSDYAILNIHTLPTTGGDTLWASGYEIYDRLSPATAKYLEGLTAIHDANFFNGIAERLGYPIREGPRGAEQNVGKNLQTVHPVIRTNPVTGWKSVFVNKGFTKRIVELTKDESDVILEYLFSLVSQNHDNQVRFKWRKNDVAIWDNRSNFHTATFDYKETRIGDRVVSLGEVPYYDPASRSRKEALEAREKEKESEKEVVIRGGAVGEQ